MEFWDEVYKKVSDAANYTAKETGKITEIAKAKFSLMREKSKLDDAFRKLGELYYQQMKNGEIVEKDISLAYDEIEEIKVEIERLQTKINLINNTKVCPKCGGKIDKDMPFCPKCGEKQAQEETEDDSNDEGNNSEEE